MLMNLVAHKAEARMLGRGSHRKRRGGEAGTHLAVLLTPALVRGSK